MRGDDSVLLLLVVTFLGAALAWAYWGGTGDELEEADADDDETGGVVDWILREPDSVVSRTVDWFASWFPGDPSEKTTGGTTPKEDVDPGDVEK